jgi:hypothetical protein
MPLTDQEISKKVRELRRTEGRIYAPLKYFRGLRTLKSVETRYKKMLKKDYKDFKTDEGVKTKTSSYTQRFRKKYPRCQVPPRYSSSYKDTFKDIGDCVQSWSRRVENWASSRSFSTGVGIRESS